MGHDSSLCQINKYYNKCVIHLQLEKYGHSCHFAVNGLTRNDIFSDNYVQIFYTHMYKVSCFILIKGSILLTFAVRQYVLKFIAAA